MDLCAPVSERQRVSECLHEAREGQRHKRASENGPVRASVAPAFLLSAACANSSTNSPRRLPPVMPRGWVRGLEWEREGC
jgi:hypothetical protein